MKGYLLRVRAKRYLLEEYGEDVEPYLSGAGATSHVKSEPEKRLRLHRMSMVWVFCHRADIRIFKSDKPELFPAVHRTLLGSEREDLRPLIMEPWNGKWKLTRRLRVPEPAVSC